MQHQALILALLVATGAHARAPVVLEPVKPEEYAAKVVAAHKGRPLVVNFWATWCEPCRLELPALVAATAKDADLVLVSLDVQKESAQARKFVDGISQKQKIPAFIAAIEDPQLFIDTVDKTWDGTVPYTLLYNRAGTLVTRLRGEQTRESFTRAIAAITRR